MFSSVYFIWSIWVYAKDGNSNVSFSLMTMFNNHRHVKICKTVPLFCGLFGEKGIAGPSVMGHPTCVLKSFALRSLYDLIIALGNIPFVSFLDFLDSLNCSLYF